MILLKNITNNKFNLKKIEKSDLEHLFVKYLIQLKKKWIRLEKKK